MAQIIDLMGDNKSGISDRNFIKLYIEFGSKACEQYLNLKKLLFLGQPIENPAAWLRNAIKTNYKLNIDWRDQQLCDFKEQKDKLFMLE